MQTPEKLRLRNKTLFTFVLIGAIFVFYFLFDRIICYWPSQWSWDLQYTVHHPLGKISVNSAFFMFSAITAIFAGMYLVDGIRRGFKNTISPKMFVLPLGVALALEFIFHGLESSYGAFSNQALHGGLLGSWLILLYIIRVIRLKLQGKSLMKVSLGEE